MAHDGDRAGLHAFSVAVTEPDNNNATDALLPLLRYAVAGSDGVTHRVTYTRRVGYSDSTICERFGYTDGGVENRRTDAVAVANVQPDPDARRSTAESRARRSRVVRVNGNGWFRRVDLAQVPELIALRSAEHDPSPPS